MLTKIARLSGAFVSLTLTLSIVYEWAYFYAVDLKWLSLFSISDYLTGSLEWLPYSFLIFGLSALLGFFVESRKNLLGPTVKKSLPNQEKDINSYEELEEEIGLLVKEIVSVYSFRKAFLYGTIAYLFLYLLGFLFINKFFMGLYVIGFLPLLISFSVVLSWQGKIAEKNIDKYFIPFIQFVVFLVVVFNTGLTNGLAVYKDGNPSETHYVLKLKTEIEKDVVLIKVLEKGVIFKENNNVLFYPAADIQYLYINLNATSLDVSAWHFFK